ncbi:MAG TPA: inositol 2-dehydrogenase [Acidobacteriota bacterium]|nr:inositol 2-dehydrogenase [Acidobacteriota bacterium]
MIDRLNIGFIGTGRIGSFHIRNLVRLLPEANVVAACDIRLEVVRAIADELGIPRVTPDYKELLADESIHAVVIASNTDTHSFMIQDAARAGKHIFSEKPLALDLPSIDAALAAVNKAGVKLQVGFNRRFDHSFRRVREIVQSGRIGRPCILHITNRDPEPPTIAYAKTSGGMFLDMSIHDFDMARYQIGEVEEVYAIGNVLVAPGLAEIGDVDTDVITLRFADGTLGVIDNSRQSPYGYDQRLEVFCAQGAARAENQATDTVLQSDYTGVYSAKPPRFFMDRYTECYVTELKEFIDCVLNDKTPPVTGNDGRLAVVIGHAAIKSWKENRPVRLSEISAT